MRKKTLLTLRLSEFDTPLVSKGDRISHGDKIIASHLVEIDEFDLSTLLEVKAATLPKYLLVTEGAPVTQGQLLAQKKGMVRKKAVKAPVAGVFTILDATKGLVAIKRQTEKIEVTSWFEGEVTDVAKEKISFQVEGTVIVAKNGKGSPVSGKVKLLSLTNSLLMMGDIENKVLVMKEATSDMIAKADALGAVAIIAEVLEVPSFTLPYLEVEDSSLFNAYHGTTIVVYGDRRQALVVDEEKDTKEHKKS